MLQRIRLIAPTLFDIRDLQRYWFYRGLWRLLFWNRFYARRHEEYDRNVIGNDDYFVPNVRRRVENFQSDISAYTTEGRGGYLFGVLYCFVFPPSIVIQYDSTLRWWLSVLSIRLGTLIVSRTTTTQQ